MSRRSVVWLMVVAACLAMPARRASAQAVPEDLAIAMRRTICFGTCPEYSVRIDAQGNVTYEGGRFVRVSGQQHDRMPADRVARLFAQANTIGFFDLKPQYRRIQNPNGTETFATDLPTTFVTVTAGGRSHVVEDYFGGPRALHEFESAIEDAARTTQWVRIDPPTVRRLAQSQHPLSADELAETLRKALQHDEVDVVKALLEIGADPNHDYDLHVHRSSWPWRPRQPGR